MPHGLIKVLLSVSVAGFGGARHASAQIDLTGIRAPIMHEDSVERVAGTRLRIWWENENLLKIETDKGQQTRRLVFDRAPTSPAERSLQGFSSADWERPGRGGGPGAGGPPSGGPGPPGAGGRAGAQDPAPCKP